MIVKKKNNLQMKLLNQKIVKNYYRLAIKIQLVNNNNYNKILKSKL